MVKYNPHTPFHLQPQAKSPNPQETWQSKPNRTPNTTQDHQRDPPPTAKTSRPSHYSNSANLHPFYLNDLDDFGAWMSKINNFFDFTLSNANTLNDNLRKNL